MGKGSLQKNWIFYDIELISIATYPPYLFIFMIVIFIEPLIALKKLYGDY